MDTYLPLCTVLHFRLTSGTIFEGVFLCFVEYFFSSRTYTFSFRQVEALLALKEGFYAIQRPPAEEVEAPR